MNIIKQHFLCLVHIGSFIPKPNKENVTFMLCDVGNRVILYHWIQRTHIQNTSAEKEKSDNTPGRGINAGPKRSR